MNLALWLQQISKIYSLTCNNWQLCWVLQMLVYEKSAENLSFRSSLPFSDRKWDWKCNASFFIPYFCQQMGNKVATQNYAWDMTSLASGFTVHVSSTLLLCNIIFCSNINGVLTAAKLWVTRMWSNAQRDGHPAEYRWRPLFNAAKFGWRPLLECRAVTLPRRQTRWICRGAPN